MVPTGRMYDTEAKARDAEAKLLAAGFSSREVSVMTPTTGAAGMPPGIPAAQQVAYGKAVEAGHSVVVVQADFQWSQTAADILNSCDPVSAHGPPLIEDRSPSPLSDLIGFPVLSKNGARFGTLARSDFSLSSMIGLKMLSKNPAPLSSMIGLKTKTKSR